VSKTDTQEERGMTTDVTETREADAPPRGRFPDPEDLAADAATFARIQAASMAVMVEAFAVAVVIDPDEPVPYYLTAEGEAAAPVPNPVHGAR
jgi:hypothetical protein